MPIYEYICPGCYTEFEQMRPISQSNKSAECPKCHKPARRKMSSFACFSTSASGVPQRVAGTGDSCSTCSSGDCSTCAL
jgi:putative FmdB family regulatory protein